MSTDTDLEPLVVAPKTAWRLLGIGHSTGYELLAKGELESFNLGPRSRRITMASIKALIERRLSTSR